MPIDPNATRSTTDASFSTPSYTAPTYTAPTTTATASTAPNPTLNSSWSAARSGSTDWANPTAPTYSPSGPNGTGTATAVAPYSAPSTAPAPATARNYSSASINDLSGWAGSGDTQAQSQLAQIYSNAPADKQGQVANVFNNLPGSAQPGFMQNPSVQLPGGGYTGGNQFGTDPNASLIAKLFGSNGSDTYSLANYLTGLLGGSGTSSLFGNSYNPTIANTGTSPSFYGQPTTDPNSLAGLGTSSSQSNSGVNSLVSLLSQLFSAPQQQVNPLGAATTTSSLSGITPLQDQRNAEVAPHSIALASMLANHRQADPASTTTALPSRGAGLYQRA